MEHQIEIMQRQLRWLGHVIRLPPEYVRQQCNIFDVAARREFKSSLDAARHSLA